MRKLKTTYTNWFRDAEQVADSLMTVPANLSTLGDAVRQAAEVLDAMHQHDLSLPEISMTSLIYDHTEVEESFDNGREITTRVDLREAVRDMLAALNEARATAQRISEVADRVDTPCEAA